MDGRRCRGGHAGNSPAITWGCVMPGHTAWRRLPSMLDGGTVWCRVVKAERIGDRLPRVLSWSSAHKFPGPRGAQKTQRHTHPTDGYPPAGVGPEATVRWWPTRTKAARFRVPTRPEGCRHQAAEGRSSGREFVYGPPIHHTRKTSERTVRLRVWISPIGFPIRPSSSCNGAPAR